MSLANLNDIRQRYGLPETAVQQLNRWLTTLSYNRRNYILPEYLSDDVPEIDYEMARLLMYLGVKVGAFKINYEIHCPKCGDRVEVVHTQDEIPTKITCENESCRYSFNPWKHQELIIISFKLLQGGS